MTPEEQTASMITVINSLMSFIVGFLMTTFVIWLGNRGRR